MKLIFAASLLISATGFAQAIDVNALKNLMTAKKASLERVAPGMSKITVEKAKDGDCAYMITSTETVLKVDADNIYFFSKQKYQPANTPACRALGETASSETKVVYLDKKPSLTEELAGLDQSAPNIKSISKAGDLITMQVAAEADTVAIQYDLTKPAFKYLVSEKGATYETTTQDAADMDVNSIDLSEVYFCNNTQEDGAPCDFGNYSDILF